MPTFTLDPTVTTGAVNRLVFGLGAPAREIWNGTGTDDTTVRQRMSDAGIKLIRVGGIQYSTFHLGGNMCTSPTSCNFTVIDNILTSIFACGAEPLFTFATYPGGVTVGDYTAYGQFMAGVVNRYNVTQVIPGKKVRYWEVWNEPSDAIDGAFTVTEYTSFVNTVGAAMKAVDPTIKLCAPAAASADFGNPGWIQAVAQNTNELLSVLCWHNYGRHDDTDQVRIDKEHASYYDDVIKARTDPVFRSVPGGKTYGAGLTEYNMAGQPLSDGNTSKFHDNYNATFLATAMIEQARAGAEIGTYYVAAQLGTNLLGVMDQPGNGWAPFKPWWALHLLNNRLGAGTQYISGSAPGSNVQYLASKSADGTKVYIVAVNQNVSSTQSVTFQLPAGQSGAYKRWVLDASTDPSGTGTALTYTAGAITYSMAPASLIGLEVDIIGGTGGGGGSGGGAATTRRLARITYGASPSRVVDLLP